MSSIFFCPFFWIAFPLLLMMGWEPYLCLEVFPRELFALEPSLIPLYSTLFLLLLFDNSTLISPGVLLKVWFVLWLEGLLLFERILSTWILNKSPWFSCLAPLRRQVCGSGGECRSDIPRVLRCPALLSYQLFSFTQVSWSTINAPVISHQKNWRKWLSLIWKVGSLGLALGEKQGQEREQLS